MANDFSGVAEIATNFGPVLGPAFIMWWYITKNGSSQRPDVVSELDHKVDKILDRLARLETKVEERFK
jgi:hypothetical protein